jgi:nitrogen-specific signal transduction histidine kinase
MKPPIQASDNRRLRQESFFSLRVFLPYVASLVAVGFVLVVILSQLGRLRTGAELEIQASVQEAATCLAHLAADRCDDVFDQTEPPGGGVVLVPSDEFVNVLELEGARIFLRDLSSPGPSGGIQPALAGDTLAMEALSGSGLAFGRSQTPEGWVFSAASVWPSQGPDWQAIAVVERRAPAGLAFLEGLRSGGLAGLFAIAVLVTFPAFILLRLSSLRRKRELEIFEEEDAPADSVAPEVQSAQMRRGEDLPELIGTLDGPLPLVLLDVDGSVVAASRAAAELLDERVEDLTGQPFRSISCFGSDARPVLAGDLRQTLDSSPVIRLVHADGRTAFARLRTASAGGDGGYQLVSIQDVSEMEAMKSEREKLIEREMALNSYAVLATMVRGFSSDLNNLLAGVIGAASLGEAVHEESDPDRQRYSAILAAAERAAAISDELIHTASLTEAQTRPLDSAAELQEIAEALRSVLPRTISMEVQLGGELPMLIADRALLRQVLYNLALRSSGALQGTGRIRFFLEEVADPSTDPRFEGAGRNPGRTRCVCISVSDGTVLPAGLQKLLTAPDVDAYEIEKSYGAGMAAVSQAVRALKGCLTCSTEARGTVIRMLFPAAEKPRTEALTGPGVSGAGISVLIAEEESIVRETTRQILEHFGFRTAEATTGDEALGILEHERFDALLLDLGSFGTPSLEVARICRERWPGMAVLLTSGYETPSGLDDPRLQPGTGFLRKPYFPEAVASEIVRLLGSLDR